MAATTSSGAELDRSTGWLASWSVGVAVTVLLAPFLAVAVALASATAASATSICYGTYKYGGYITTYYHNRGIAGDINYAQNDMYLYNDYTDHGLIYVNASSQSDSSAQYGFAWLQAGWFVGAMDQAQTNTTIAYAETNDLNAGPTAHTYPSLAWGNRYFEVEWSGETGYGGRGLYKAYYLNYTLLAQDYLVSPQYTQQSGTAEGYLGSSAGYCPIFSSGYFGTNGNPANLQWNSSTELEIFSNTPLWVLWTPGNITTSNATNNPPYTLTTYSSDDAYAIGGGGT